MKWVREISKLYTSGLSDGAEPSYCCKQNIPCLMTDGEPKFCLLNAKVDRVEPLRSGDFDVRTGGEIDSRPQW